MVLNGIILVLRRNSGITLSLAVVMLVSSAKAVPNKSEVHFKL